MCIVCMPGPKEGQKSVSDPLELELLPMVIRCYMGDRNGIQILYKSSLICWAISLDPESNLKNGMLLLSTEALFPGDISQYHIPS